MLIFDAHLYSVLSKNNPGKLQIEINVCDRRWSDDYFRDFVRITLFPLYGKCTRLEYRLINKERTN